MAKYWEGDGRGVLKGGVLGNAPCLPPRFPTFMNRSNASADFGTGVSSHQTNTRGQRQHQRTPSCNIVIQEQPSWLDDLLEDSEVPSKKGSHRRSASDSFTYADNGGSLYMFSNIAEEDETECINNASTGQSKKGGSLDGLDGDQLTDLLEEIQQLQNQQKVPISSRMSHPSNSKLENRHVSTVSEKSNISSSGRILSEGSAGQIGSRSDPGRLDDGTYSLQDNVTGNMLPGDPVDDPKRAKRVLANRQSAQRSRVRKLQYIAELERTVNALQAEVSTLSPQVVYFEHQRALLNMDNSALKQRITMYMRDKKFKDFQNETLKKEIQRLQTLYHIQLLQKERGQRQQQPQLQRLQRHSSLPSDLGYQKQQFDEANMCLQPSADEASSDTLSGLVKSFASISLMAGSSSCETADKGQLNGSTATTARVLEGKAAMEHAVGF